MQNKKQQVKCPVCGRFTSEKAVEDFNAKQNAKLNSVSAALADSQQKLENLKLWLAEKNDRIKQMDAKIQSLSEKWESAEAEIERLKNRGLWARIFNN